MAWRGRLSLVQKATGLNGGKVTQSTPNVLGARPVSAQVSCALPLAPHIPDFCRMWCLIRSASLGLHLRASSGAMLSGVPIMPPVVFRVSLCLWATYTSKHTNPRANRGGTIRYPRPPTDGSTAPACARFRTTKRLLVESTEEREFDLPQCFCPGRRAKSSLAARTST